MKDDKSLHDPYVKGGALMKLLMWVNTSGREMRTCDEAYPERKAVKVNISGVIPGRAEPTPEAWMHLLPFSLDCHA